MGDCQRSGSGHRLVASAALARAPATAWRNDLSDPSTQSSGTDGSEPQVRLDEWLLSPDGRFRACFTDIGEGRCGEYNADDPEDEPLLRFDVQTSDAASAMAQDPASAGVDDEDDPDYGWYWVRDGSYCTQANAERVTGEQLHQLLTRLLQEIDGETGSVKRQLEMASWWRADSADTSRQG